MRRGFLAVGLSVSMLVGGGPLAACGGNFGQFVSDMKAEAVRKGHSKSATDAFFSGVRQDPKVIKADRAQGIFQRPFLDFSQRLISSNRIQN
ncbi:MAG: lytic murein transglycosylase, partial [Boseongicola sp.]|nr:lytic murein transglycosylase [Boseongicola sp.]